MTAHEWHDIVVRRLTPLIQDITAEELTDLLVEGDFDVTGAAFQIFQSRLADALAQGVLLAGSPNPERRTAACRLLALGARSGVPDEELPQLLLDPESDVVAAAIHAYEVLQVVRSSEEFRKRVTADTATATIPWPEPIPAHVDLTVLAPLAHDSNTRPRMALAMALWMCGDALATRLLLELAHDDDGDVREAALHSMGWKRYSGGTTEEVLAVLWTAGRNSAGRPRAEALTSLVKLQQLGAEEAFINELWAAVSRDETRGEIHPMVELLHSPLSAFLPSELREEACQRWAKGLVGKGPPRAGSATHSADGATGD